MKFNRALSASEISQQTSLIAWYRADGNANDYAGSHDRTIHEAYLGLRKKE